MQDAINTANVLTIITAKIQEEKNLLTIVEQDTDRLKKLKKEQEVQIGEQRKLKEEIENDIVCLKRDKSNLTLDVSNLEKDKTLLCTEIEQAQKDLQSSNELKKQMTAEISSLKDGIEKTNAEALKQHEFLTERERNVSAREEGAEKKHQAIKELVNSLK